MDFEIDTLLKYEWCVYDCVVLGMGHPVELLAWFINKLITFIFILIFYLLFIIFTNLYLFIYSFYFILFPTEAQE